MNMGKGQQVRDSELRNECIRQEMKIKELTREIQERNEKIGELQEVLLQNGFVEIHSDLRVDEQWNNVIERYYEDFAYEEVASRVNK